MRVVRTVLVAGPRNAVGGKVYGGGVGGYTRNLAAYVSSLRVPGFEFLPFHCSVRGMGNDLQRNLVVRLLTDLGNLYFACRRQRPWAVHVLAQYRGALPRELGMALICRMLRIRYIYDVKAGAFQKEYANASWWYRKALNFILKSSTAVLAEGEASQRFLRDELNTRAVFFPNFVPDSEIPATPTRLFSATELRILFVGYCYPDKGVAPLIEGCRRVAEEGIRVSLSVVGTEAEEFTRWADSLPAVANFRIVRHGRLPHAQVLEKMKNVDIYGYPTAHPGEGHNNSINEAMMHGLVVVTTQHGFLGDVLPADAAYFVPAANAAHIADAIRRIAANREEAAAKGARARGRLLAEFTSTRASERLREVYETVA